MTPPDKGPEIDPSPWTQEELILLHEMVRGYDRSKWLKSQAKWWFISFLAAPPFFVSLWQAFDWVWHKVGAK